MAYRKKTLRAMPATTRRLARLIADLDSVSRRAKNLLPEIERLEMDSRALWKSRKGDTDG
jgi:hypothetical protein